jgi:hypothetical protein
MTMLHSCFLITQMAALCATPCLLKDRDLINCHFKMAPMRDRTEGEARNGQGKKRVRGVKI